MAERSSGRRVLPSMSSLSFMDSASRAAASFQPVFLALLKQRLAADAQDLGRTADLVVRGFESGSDDFLLDLVERTQPGKGPGGAHRRGSHVLWEVPRFDGFAARKHHG